ncbi:putative U6 snRNA-associated Sm-like protein LSm4 [Tetrabaena socialis]|uniref:U6 snRNA-associated Sm-like protein LSm4 n=1 Tax=Tetrabaena socialis TaxID=47790 RepID=A0A2J8A2K0_9CHLO|nr:putative U6 snRNA-associated Sm-like protein LSm4 [Tetrabaena socialis]|eukprot:PNH06749.1 putative U6 snRNA-associated Sm-like protein LSm4 [Tetrabaena socialis]
MLPLSLLKTAQRHAVLVELKNGETYNGYLQQCDTWMNLHLAEVICTSKDGQRFFKMPETYLRGNTIKYISVPEEVIDKVQEENLRRDGEWAGWLGWGSRRNGRREVAAAGAAEVGPWAAAALRLAVRGHLEAAAAGGTAVAGAMAGEVVRSCGDGGRAAAWPFKTTGFR